MFFHCGGYAFKSREIILFAENAGPAAKLLTAACFSCLPPRVRVYCPCVERRYAGSAVLVTDYEPEEKPKSCKGGIHHEQSTRERNHRPSAAP